MPNYVYQGKDANGGSIAGRVTAANVQDASRQLRADGKVVLDLHEHVESAAARTRLRRVGPEDVMHLTHQLAVMVETGVPLTEALDGVAKQTSHTGLAELVRDIGDHVKAGEQLSTALARHPKCFGPLFVNTVRASEASGLMGPMLERLSQYLRGQHEMHKQVRGAMVYPAFMLVFSIAVLVAMLGFILPRFKGIYTGKEAALPLPTRMLLNLGSVVADNWLLLAAGTGVLATALMWYLGSPQGQYLLDRLRLRVPLVGPLYQKLYVSRALRTLGTMIASGVNMLEGIQITSSVVGNVLHRDMWLRIAERLREGRTLTDEMFATPLVPHNIAQMVASGEKSGRVSSVMERVADYCETDLRIGIKALTSLIEPAMILIMGTIVGLIAIALLLPIFSISKVVAH